MTLISRVYLQIVLTRILNVIDNIAMRTFAEFDYYAA